MQLSASVGIHKPGDTSDCESSSWCSSCQRVHLSNDEEDDDRCRCWSDTCRFDLSERDIADKQKRLTNNVMLAHEPVLSWQLPLQLPAACNAGKSGVQN